jgi:type IV secretory pathway TraG/TraD family ATPase VirD4
MKNIVFYFYLAGPIFTWLLIYVGIFKGKSKHAVIGFVFTYIFVFFYSLNIYKNPEEESKKMVTIIMISYILIPLVLGYINWLFRRKLEKSEKEKRTKQIEENNKNGFYTFKTTRGNIEVKNPYRGTIVVGGAGSGKSKSFIYPIISQSAKMNFSGVLYDFKSPELIEYTELQYLNSRIKTQRIDFKDIKKSERVNPLKYINNSTEATNYAQALIFNLMPEYISKQDFWSRSVLALFSGCIWYFIKNKPELATLPHIISFLVTANSTEIIQILTKDREIKGYLSSLSEAVEQKAERQVAGVLGTLKNAIGIYNNPEIFWLLSKDEVNLDVNNKINPSMLLIGNNSKLAETYAPLISLIITITSKLMNEPNKERSTIIIDEAPTLYLPNFEQIPATARSNKVAVVVGTQDLAQMTDKYGREKADVLISNLGNQFYGRTTNKETAERVVKMFGQREDIEIMQGSSGSGCLAIFFGAHTGRSNSQTIVKRDRVKIQEITNFKPGQFAAMIAEGNVNDFVGQFVSEEDNQQEVISLKEGTTNEIMNLNFEDIYNDIETFLKSNKKSFGFD